MPVYEYRRPDGSTFEVLQSIHDDALTHDPETGVPVVRVLHPPAIHLPTAPLRGRQKRLLERAASEGANQHDEKFHYERREKKQAWERYERDKKKAFEAAKDRSRVERKPPPKWVDD